MRTVSSDLTTLTPGHAGYETARRVWNARFDCRPDAIAYPRDADEVAAAIGRARERSMPFRIRSGGHNVEGFSVLDGGLVIDLSRMDSMTVAGTRATIGPGVLLGDLYRELWAAGVTVPAGVCPDIRIGGHVMGGGVGMLVRSRGMLVDSLVGLTMVDADGHVLVVDDKSHPDLMWACRGGGGGNFGVATSYTFDTRAIGDVTVVSLTWDWDDGFAALEDWQHWVISADPRVNSRFSLFPSASGKAMMTALFEGSADEWRAVAKDLTDAHPPRESSVRTVPWLDTVGMFSERTPSARAKFVPALAHGPLGTDALKVLERRHRDAPPGVKTGLYGLGGAVQDEHAAARSAFPHRDSQFCVEYLGHWHDQTADAEHLAWLAATRDEMGSFMTGGAYVNSPDRDLDTWLHAYYLDNLPRLMDVKATFDPHDVFAFEQSIPGSLTESRAQAAGLTQGVRAELRARNLITADNTDTYGEKE